MMLINSKNWQTPDAKSADLRAAELVPGDANFC